jgi:hypothetical protein
MRKKKKKKAFVRFGVCCCSVMTIPPTCWTVEKSWFDSQQGAFCSSTKRPHWLWSTPSLQLNRSKEALSPSIKRPGCDNDHSPHSVKNKWSYTSNPNMYWYVQRDSLTFYMVQRSWEAHTVILSLRKEKASGTVVASIHGTSFRGLGITGQ